MDYCEIKRFRIYALILEAEETFVFVGKTTGRRLSAAYSRHRTGSVAATEGYFNQDLPKMYLLEDLEATMDTAYRHVVAWCRIFREEGYALLNHDGTLAHMEDMAPRTEAIWRELQKEPLEQILRRTWLPRPADGDEKPLPKPQPPEDKTVQMNIRLQETQKEAFQRFCEAGAFSQREGFGLLLDKAANGDAHMQGMLKARDERIGMLEAENRKLRTKLRERKPGQKSQREQLLEGYLEFSAEGIRRYLQLLFPENEGRSTLPECAYRKFIKYLPWGEKPRYPEEEGFLVLKLETILWGSGLRRSSFVVGIGEDGLRYRLRCYPRKTYLGLPLRGSALACPGARWLLGCRKSSDGAMELMAGFPLLPEPAEEPVPEAPIMRQKPSLESQIRSAAGRR